MKQFRVSKDVVAFVVWPKTPDNLVRIYCHLFQKCVELITLPHFVLSFPMKTMVSSVYFSAGMTI
jgi:hypothetical protein